MYKAAAQSSPLPPSRALVLWIFVAGVVSTTIHYAHNYAYASHYPPIYPFFPTDFSYRVGIVVFWPLLTALGAWGVRQYWKGRITQGAWLLLIWMPLGLTTPGHFLGGMPHIPPFAMFSVCTDFGFSLVMMVLMLQALYTTRQGSKP